MLLDGRLFSPHLSVLSFCCTERSGSDGIENVQQCSGKFFVLVSSGVQSDVTCQHLSLDVVT